MADAASQDSKTGIVKFLEAAKDFSFDQKLSVVQSVLGGIPREQQQPWNPSQQTRQKQDDDPDLVFQAKGSEEDTSFAGASTTATVENDEVDQYGVSKTYAISTTELCQERSIPQPPPLIDPYEKSMKYYEKHLVLNHFQVHKLETMPNDYYLCAVAANNVIYVVSITYCALSIILCCSYYSMCCKPVMELP